MKLIWKNKEYDCSHAVRIGDTIKLYDEKYNLIHHIIGIPDNEWESISLQNGDWTPDFLIPSEFDILRADIDYLLMMQE